MDPLVDSASSEKRRRGFQITCVEHQPGLVAGPGGTLGGEPPSPRAGSRGTPSPTAPAERCRTPSPRFRLVRLDSAAAASTPSIRRGRWTCVEFVDAQWRDDATSSQGCGPDPATGSCKPPRSPRFRKVVLLEERCRGPAVKGAGPPFPAPLQHAGPRTPDPGNPLANPGLGPPASDPGGRAPASPKPPGSPSCAESPRASTPCAEDTCDGAAEVPPVRAAFVSPTLVLPSFHDYSPRPLPPPPPPPARISLPALAAALPVSSTVTSSTSSLLRPPPPCAETHSAPGSPVTPRAAPSERRGGRRPGSLQHGEISQRGSFSSPWGGPGLTVRGAQHRRGAFDVDSASGASVVAIDNKIEQAMDLVKSHLMFAVREEVEVLKDQIKELVERNSHLERENSALKGLASPEQLRDIQAQLTGRQQRAIGGAPSSLTP
ncbi:TSC22 domain family protein 4-like isoform X1 [Petromyzon marinus]|uniref:TSC22 domain family protein 4-like isoform X1 n=1 Tax=Petromyzon marinus TaxID=7757 RepID=UPI003F6FECF2